MFQKMDFVSIQSGQNSNKQLDNLNNPLLIRILLGQGSRWGPLRGGPGGRSPLGQVGVPGAEPLVRLKKPHSLVRLGQVRLAIKVFFNYFKETLIIYISTVLKDTMKRTFICDHLMHLFSLFKSILASCCFFTFIVHLLFTEKWKKKFSKCQIRQKPCDYE